MTMQAPAHSQQRATKAYHKKVDCLCVAIKIIFYSSSGIGNVRSISDHRQENLTRTGENKCGEAAR